MNYVVSWKLSPDQFKTAAQLFMASPPPAPPGVKIIGRWHALGSTRGWLIVEAEEIALATYLAKGGSLIEYEVTPVITDEQALEAYKDISLEE